MNGSKRIGYISASDVEEPTDQPVNLSGIALKQKTNVYSSLNDDSRVLKDYSQGSKLYYQTYLNGWYKAIVYVNGERKTGYIKASDVEQPVENQENLKGVAVKDRVYVYDRPSRQSGQLKSYRAGKLLYYKTYLNNWYEALVYVNGKPKTGYIHKSDVEEPVENQKSLKGYAYNSTVHVYKLPSKGASSLKSYREGKLLYYKTYLKNWYEAIVYVNNKRTTGYIYKSDVINQNAKQDLVEGYASKEKTYVYKSTSKNSKKLKGYDFNSKLIFKTFTRNWYEAIVFVDGERHKGYISKDDISLDKFTFNSIVNPKTEYSYNQMVSDIKKLENTYPHLIEAEVIGRSNDGRKIYAVKIGKGSNDTLVTASIHAREWISTNLVMEQIDSYAEAYMKDNRISGVDVKDTLNDVTLHFITMVNPDGVTLVQEGAYALSNTSQLLNINNGSNDFKHWKSNGRGVDINRNFSVGWDNAGSYPDNPSSQFYKGPSPVSEPESLALVNYASRHNFNGAISYHSSGQLIYWDGSARGANHSETRRIANIAGNKTGYTVIREIDQYLGHFSDWFAYHINEPFITPELSPSVGDRPVPLSHFNDIWDENDTLPLIIANELK
ncbi:M14 family zinc carboxypeptidase [Piscibacillus salipiscarius]|uniref:M14 family zinc carboxypeptidase n=1 Tax=Piscibacillus salipiscarius TaxID=299480 RepID=UPI0006D18BA3|nr:M14 family zinc carboxypeptidase [Piscibacillus salipiscarius]